MLFQQLETVVVVVVVVVVVLLYIPWMQIVIFCSFEDLIVAKNVSLKLFCSFTTQNVDTIYLS